MRVNRFRAGCGPITARLTFGIYGTLKVPTWQYFCVISPLWISRFTGFWLKNNRGDLEDIWSAVHALDLWLKPAFRNRLQHGKLPGPLNWVPGQFSAGLYGRSGPPGEQRRYAATLRSPSRGWPRRNAHIRAAAPAQSTRWGSEPAQYRRGRR